MTAKYACGKPVNGNIFCLLCGEDRARHTRMGIRKAGQQRDCGGIFVSRRSRSTARRRRRPSRRRVSRQNRAAMAIILGILIIVFAVLFVQGRHLQKRIDETNSENAALKEQISAEEARTDSIYALSEYMQTDDYVKQAAKDRLGLVESNEVVFKDSNGK